MLHHIASNGSQTQTQPAHVSTAYVPRRERSRRRADRAFREARDQGRTAFESAQRMIAAIGGEFADVNRLKMEIDGLMLRGPGAARGFYADIAKTLPTRDIDLAIVEIERAYASERTQIRLIETNFLGGPNHRMRLTKLDRLNTARVILRWMRATERAHLYPRLREMLTAPMWNPVAISEDGSVIAFEPNHVDWE